MSFQDIPVVDAWMQHPTEEFLAQEMFATLRRWQGEDARSETPLEWTVQAYEDAGVDTALVSAWWGPEGPLLPTEYVADLVSDHPALFTGIGSVQLDTPREAIEEVRRCVEDYGFVGIRAIPWLWELHPTIDGTTRSMQNVCNKTSRSVCRWDTLDR